MGFLIDTNVLSELRKGSKMDKCVREWFDAVPSDDIYLSTLVVGEIRHGIELLEAPGGGNQEGRCCLFI
jgi:predicted nucleic acid-binding protein